MAAMSDEMSLKQFARKIDKLTGKGKNKLLRKIPAEIIEDALFRRGGVAFCFKDIRRCNHHRGGLYRKTWTDCNVQSLGKQHDIHTIILMEHHIGLVRNVALRCSTLCCRKPFYAFSKEINLCEYTSSEAPRGYISFQNENGSFMDCEAYPYNEKYGILRSTLEYIMEHSRESPSLANTSLVHMSCIQIGARWTEISLNIWL